MRFCRHSIDNDKQLLADGRWRIAHTLSPAEADYPLSFAVSAYYRVKDDG